MGTATRDLQGVAVFSGNVKTRKGNLSKLAKPPLAGSNEVNRNLRKSIVRISLCFVMLHSLTRGLDTLRKPLDTALFCYCATSSQRKPRGPHCSPVPADGHMWHEVPQS